MIHNQQKMILYFLTLPMILNSVLMQKIHLIKKIKKDLLII